jgi:hypothetical protein
MLTTEAMVCEPRHDKHSASHDGHYGSGFGE